MRSAVLAIALLMSGAAIAQTTTTTTTEPDIDVDADVGVQPDGDLDVDADVDVGTKTTTTTTVHDTAVSSHSATPMASAMPASGQVVQPSNADPERDARGIAVISDPAVVPAGFNGTTGAGTGVGGPAVDPVTGATVTGTDASHPACTATITDNCVQTYERGRRN
jgi:hypothetical protein